MGFAAPDGASHSTVHRYTFDDTIDADALLIVALYDFAYTCFEYVQSDAPAGPLERTLNHLVWDPFASVTVSSVMVLLPDAKKALLPDAKRA